MSGRDPIADLSKWIGELREMLSAFPVDVEHYVSDNALFGFAIDIIEHGLAVDLLRKSEVPRAAYVNARAAFEAGMDILFLTSDSSRYDEYGCLARVHEACEAERLQGRFNTANAESGLSLQDAQNAAALIEEDAKAWDDLVPGAGAQLRTAEKAFRLRKNLAKKHWTGLTREEIGKSVADQLGAEPGVAQIYSAMYGGLSAQSHPQMRNAQREIRVQEDGGFLFAAKAGDREAPATAAAYACISAITALKRRSGFFPSAS